MFLVVSRSNTHFAFEQPFFACPISQKIGCLERNLSTRGKYRFLMISETNVDDSCRIGNFLIGSFSTPYLSDHDSKGGGTMLFVKVDTPFNLLTIKNKPNDKLLINYFYNPHKNKLSSHVDKLSKSMDLFSSDYEKVVVLGEIHRILL